MRVLILYIYTLYLYIYIYIYYEQYVISLILFLGEIIHSQSCVDFNLIISACFGIRHRNHCARLCRAGITCLSASLFRMDFLTSLYMSNNNLTLLPTGIARLRGLRILGEVSFAPNSTFRRFLGWEENGF